MDPNANLAGQLRLARDVASGKIAADVELVRLAELVLELDAWMRRGGFKPAAWDVKPPGMPLGFDQA